MRVVGININITDRKEAEKALHDSVARQSSQNEAFHAAMGGAPLQNSLSALVRTAVQSYGGTARAAFYITRDGTTLSHLVGMSDAYARDVDGVKAGRDSPGCGLALHRREPVISPDVVSDPQWQRWLWIAQKHQYRACWSFPLCTKDGPVLGTFALYFSEPRYPTAQDYELVSGLTHAATIILSP